MCDPLLDDALAALAALAVRDLGDPTKAHRAAKICNAIDHLRRLFVTRVGEVAKQPAYVMGMNEVFEVDTGVGNALVAPGHGDPSVDVFREVLANVAPFVTAAQAKMTDDARRRRLAELRALREARLEMGDETYDVDAQIRALGKEIIKSGGTDGTVERADVVRTEFSGRPAAEGRGDGERAEDVALCDGALEALAKHALKKKWQVTHQEKR